MTNMTRGDQVRIRSAREILATLDERGALDGIPFMPEMVDRCGTSAVVASRCDKLCDTVSWSVRSVQMPATVVLNGIRCKGSEHGGCQAACLVYWKEEWLAGDADAAADDESEDQSEAREALRQLALANTQPTEGTFRCQATAFPEGTRAHPNHDPRPFVAELLNGDVSPTRFVRVTARLAAERSTKLIRKVGQKVLPTTARRHHDALPPIRREPLGLIPGELVRIRRWEEITLTLDERLTNKGLTFDPEMRPYCGTIQRVRARVSRIVDERTGKMINIGRDCIMLEDVVCSGDRSYGRWFCPRAIYPYWREAWLERVGAAPQPGVDAPPESVGASAR